MNRWFPTALIIVGLGFSLSQCKPEKDFKAEGVITDRSASGIEIMSLVPNPLKTNTKECNVINITEQEIKCNEIKENLTYTHSVKTKDIGDKTKETLHIGMNISLRLPTLKSIPLKIPQQKVFIPLVNIQEGMPVFINGTYKDNDIKIKGVYESSPLNTSITALIPTPPTSSNNTLPNSPPTNINNGLIKVCVPNNFLNTNNQLTFDFFRREGNTVIKYELMHPNVQVDKVGSGIILEEPGMKLLIMSSDLTVVEGIEVVNNNINCVNPENTPVPPWRSKSVAAISTNTTTKYVKQSRGGINFKTITLYLICTVLFIPIAAYMGLLD